MTNERMTHEQMTTAVDDALRTHSLVPAPATLRPAVMAHVRALTSTPRFRLAWIDYAMSLFAAGMVALGIILWQSIPPQMAARAQLQFLYFAQVVNLDAPSLWPALLAGLLLAAWAALAGAVVFRRSLR